MEKKVTNNPEYAKNARQHKKNCIEALKSRIGELSGDIALLEQGRMHKLADAAQRTVLRKMLLQALFDHRVAGELRRSSWSDILEEEFKMVMPITPYRSFPPAQVKNGQRLVDGIDAFILDTASLHTMIQSIAPHPPDHNSYVDEDVDGSSNSKVIVQMKSDPDSTVMTDNTFMTAWTFFTVNAMMRGCFSELSQNGMLKATFSPTTNKLVYLEQTFDVMSFMQQLRQASGKSDFYMMPNTPALAKDQQSREARIIIDFEPPHQVSFVNQAWQDSIGYRGIVGLGAADLLEAGFGPVLEKGVHDDTPHQDHEPRKGQLENKSGWKGSEKSDEWEEGRRGRDQGHVACDHKMVEFRRAMERGFPCSIVLNLYTFKGVAVRIWIRLYPLYSMGKVSQFMVVMQALDEGNGPNAQTYPMFTTKNLANSSSLEAHRVMLEAEAAGAAAGALAEAGSSTQDRSRQRRTSRKYSGRRSYLSSSSDGSDESYDKRRYVDTPHNQGNQRTSETDEVQASTISSKSMNNHSRSSKSNNSFGSGRDRRSSGYGGNAELTDANLNNPARGTTGGTGLLDNRNDDAIDKYSGDGSGDGGTSEQGSSKGGAQTSYDSGSNKLELLPLSSGSDGSVHSGPPSPTNRYSATTTAQAGVAVFCQPAGNSSTGFVGSSPKSKAKATMSVRCNNVSPTAAGAMLAGTALPSTYPGTSSHSGLKDNGSGVNGNFAKSEWGSSTGHTSKPADLTTRGDSSGNRSRGSESGSCDGSGADFEIQEKVMTADDHRVIVGEVLLRGTKRKAEN